MTMNALAITSQLNTADIKVTDVNTIEIVDKNLGVFTILFSTEKMGCPCFDVDDVTGKIRGIVKVEVLWDKKRNMVIKTVNDKIMRKLPLPANCVNVMARPSLFQKLRYPALNVMMRTADGFAIQREI